MVHITSSLLNLSERIRKKYLSLSVTAISDRKSWELFGLNDRRKSSAVIR